MTLHLVVMLHACCPGDYYRLMGYCNGRRDISSTVSFCCFSKHRETPLRGKQKIMARQWYPDLRLDGSWQVWTDSNVHTQTLVWNWLHSQGWTRCMSFSSCVHHQLSKACVCVSILMYFGCVFHSCGVVSCLGDDLCHISQTQLPPSVF